MRNERVKGSIRLLSGIEHTRNGVSTWKRLLFKWGREFWNFEGKLPKNYKFISKLRQKITTLICNFFPTKILTTGVEKITKNYKKSFVIFFSKFCLQTVRKYYKKWQFVRINYNLDTLDIVLISFARPPLCFELRFRCRQWCRAWFAREIRNEEKITFLDK